MVAQDKRKSDDTIEQLERILKSEAQDNRISCSTALDAARQAGVSPATVGALLDKLGIRITRCQLGCF
jgi:hypothetical protein